MKNAKDENQINVFEENPEPIEIIECKNIEEFLKFLEDVYQGEEKIERKPPF